MLIMKKSVEGHGLTALINRQLQGKFMRLLECVIFVNVLVHVLSIVCLRNIFGSRKLNADYKFVYRKIVSKYL